MKLQYLIQQHQAELSELDRGILNYILSHGDTVLSMGIVELSEQVHVSKSSILRLTKKLSFSGYSEFKYFLRHQQEQATTISQQKTIFEKQQEDIFATLNYVKTVDLAALNRLFDRSKTIYCYPTGFSQKKALEEFSKMMLSMEKRVIVLPNKTEFDMVMPMITAEDCVIIASLSGETENVKENLTTFAIRQIPVLTLSAPGDNYFARHSTFHLTYYCDFFQIGRKKIPSQSLIGLSCLIDYLIRSYGLFTLQEGNHD